MDTEIKRACPYCGHTVSDEPVMAIKDESTIKLFQSHGLPIPMIVTCQNCHCTMDDRAFVVGSPEYVALNTGDNDRKLYDDINGM